uniref:Uncharacterized protein n=1 Tax=virus sp. ctkyY8 TaxID=2827995 RepID=A0A8S5RDS1_9VIRU|nr:MAG TPA: hypothetical protein [virus sp. ctkyY8]
MIFYEKKQKNFQKILNQEISPWSNIKKDCKKYEKRLKSL